MAAYFHLEQIMSIQKPPQLLPVSPPKPSPRIFSKSKYPMQYELDPTDSGFLLKEKGSDHA